MDRMSLNTCYMLLLLPPWNLVGSLAELYENHLRMIAHHTQCSTYRSHVWTFLFFGSPLRKGHCFTKG